MDEAIAITVTGLRDFNTSMTLFCRGVSAHPSSSLPTFQLTTWFENDIVGPQPIKHDAHASPSQTAIASRAMFPLTRIASQPVRLVDVVFLRLEAICTLGIRSKIKKLVLDVNGFELFNLAPDESEKMLPPSLPAKLGFDATAHDWAALTRLAHRDCVFDPPKLSSRLLPLSLKLERIPAECGNE